MYATTKWWCRLENTYEVKADMVCLHIKLCDAYLSAFEVVYD